jgi:hypothetical protein
VGDSSYLIKGGFEMRMLVSASSETLELKGFLYRALKRREVRVLEQLFLSSKLKF